MTKIKSSKKSFLALHEWNVTPKQAIEIQNTLRPLVVEEDDIANVEFVAGVDVGFKSQGAITRASVAVLAYPQLELCEHSVVEVPTSFPYVPGLLSFREIPAVLEALKKLRCLPDLILCDGQGIAHPRRFGVACHLGVLTGIPTVGVAKSRLVGTYGVIPSNKGGFASLMDGGEIIGAVLRTRAGVKPVFVSRGHKVSLPTAVEWTMRCVSRYRLPETTRWAHKLASPGK